MDWNLYLNLMKPINMIIPRGKNLVVYYCLPLVGVNPKTFGRDLKTAYISKKGGYEIFVESRSNTKKQLLELNPTFKYSFSLDVKTKNKPTFLYVFELKEFHSDFDLIREGKYSRISKEAKEEIYKLSSLDYNTMREGMRITHFVLQALNKSKKLKEMWTTVLNVSKENLHEELVDRPDESWYIENKLKTLK